MLSFYTFLSRILGLLRDHYMAVTFGTGMVASAFSVAYRLPNMFRNLLAEGTLSQSFMPLYSDAVREGDEAASRMAGAVVSFLFFVLSLLVAAFLYFSGWFLPLIVGGSEQYQTAALDLSHILFFLIMTASLSSLYMAISYSKNRFFVPSLSPIILNLSYLCAFIVAIPFYESMMDRALILSYFVVGGGVLQLLVQMFYVYRLGLSPRFNLDWRHPAIVKIYRLMLPAAVGGGFYQISLLVDVFLANYVQNNNPGLGAVVSLDYSQRLIQLPTGIIGVALATTILPQLLKSLREEKLEEVPEELVNSVGFSLFLTLPAMFGLLILGRPVLDAIFYGGKWDHKATSTAMDALFFYSMAIPFFSMNKILTSSYYAFKDTKTPLRINMISFSVNIAVNLLLINYLLHAGIAIASVISSSITFTLLAVNIRKHGIEIPAAPIFDRLYKISIPLLALALFSFVVYQMMYDGIMVQLETVFSYANASRLFLAVFMIPAGVLYFGTAWLVKVEEMRIITGKISAKRNSKKKSSDH